MTQRLVALDGTGDDTFVDRLRRIWNAGDAAFVVDPRLPLAQRERTVQAMRVGDAVGPDDALVVATSGTTGNPRGVVLTHAAVAASADATSRRLGIDADDRWLACLPLAHVGGLSVVTRALHTGTPVTVLPRADPAAIDASPATRISLVATVLRRIDTTRWRTIVLGGAAPPPDRPANTVATYGMTETGSGVVYDGRPLDGVEVDIADDGGIRIRGPMLLRCYRDGHDPKTATGWLPTGDVGRWLDDGRLHVDGRRGDLIITGGENVWPTPVERVLVEHPAIGDAMVFGVRDAEWGQRVVAQIVLRPGAAAPTRDELRDLVAGRLPAFMAPKQIEVVDAIARTALGKPKRPSPPSRPE